MNSIPSNSQITSNQSFRSSLSGFLSAMAFSTPALRIGVELSAALVLFTAANSLLSNLLQLDSAHLALYSWFISCFTVAGIDHLMINRTLGKYRQANELLLQNEWARALTEVELIGPTSGRLIKLPAELYHVFRAQALALSGYVKGALDEADKACSLGLEKSHLVSLRCLIYRIAGDNEAAMLELENAEAGDKIELIEYERALQLISDKRDFRNARKILLTLERLSVEQHFSGLQLYFLAGALRSVCDLWTGRAEEGIEDLSVAVNHLSFMVGSRTDLRGELSLLLAERALYWATHREPELARHDLERSSILCGLSHHRRLRNKVSEELEFRY